MAAISWRARAHSIKLNTLWLHEQRRFVWSGRMCVDTGELRGIITNELLFAVLFLTYNMPYNINLLPCFELVMCYSTLLSEILFELICFHIHWNSLYAISAIYPLTRLWHCLSTMYSRHFHRVSHYTSLDQRNLRYLRFLQTKPKMWSQMRLLLNWWAALLSREICTILQ